MENLCRTFLEHLSTVRSLTKPQIPANTSDEEILQIIQSAARKIGLLRLENDQILDQLLFCRKPEDLSAEEAAQLQDFACGLCRKGNRVTDAGVAYYIHRLLDDYALLHHDTAMHIEQLFFLGTSLYFLSLRWPGAGISLYGWRVHEYFAEGASYFPQYHQFREESTRYRILANLVNQKIGLDCLPDSSGRVVADLYDIYPAYNDIFRRTEAILTSEQYRAENPSLPWDRMMFAMHYDRTKFLDCLPDHEDRQLVQDMLVSAQYALRYQTTIAKSREAGASAEVECLYAIARCHAGQLSLPQLLEQLLRLWRQADCSDFSQRGIMANIRIPIYIRRYLALLPPQDAAHYDDILHQMMERSTRYLLHAPRNEYSDYLAQSVLDLAAQRADLDPDFSAHLLDYFLACHLPTYIHSRMVGNLCRMLMRQLIATRPEALIGVKGLQSAEEIRAHQEELASHAYFCGLYHDVGKVTVLSRISVYGRRLTAEEFRCIQLHTRTGAHLLRCCGMDSDYAAVALYHHRFHDGSQGYPEALPPCPAEARPLVSLVTAADSLDAATDQIGRSYSVAKDLDVVLGELRARSGTQYAPDVVQLFDSPDFCRSLRTQLYSLRQRIYCTTYHELGDEHKPLIAAVDVESAASNPVASH